MLHPVAVPGSPKPENPCGGRGFSSAPLDSESVTRILTTPHRTLIAQLTLTALPESPVDRNNIGLAVTRQPGDVTRTAIAGIR